MARRRSLSQRRKPRQRLQSGKVRIDADYHQVSNIERSLDVDYKTKSSIIRIWLPNRKQDEPCTYQEAMSIPNAGS